MGLRGRERLFCLLAGAMPALAFPPFGILPGLAGFGLLLSQLDRDDPKPRWAAFRRGWLAGLGYFGVSTCWVVEPFLVDARTYAWMAPFALVLMATGLAVFWGLAGLIYRTFRPNAAWRRCLVFAGALAGMEWLRGHVFTGFPWDLPGEVWKSGTAPSQLASVIGAYGLTFVTLALAACSAAFWDRKDRGDRIWAGLVILAGLAGLYGWGSLRLAEARPPEVTAPVIRLVQANIDQKTKWRAENLDMIFATYLDLTTRPGARTPDVVVWPEGALPAVIDDLLQPGSPYLSRLTLALKPGQTLMMGANRAGYGPEGQTLYFNSLVALRREASGELSLSGVYDKHRLVPFGEFLPLGRLAGQVGLRSLVHMPEDFTPGPSPKIMTLPGLPALQPLICYEALFPGFMAEARALGGHRPAWILNVSNDAWFGSTSGPWQHLNMAGYRAIEEGLPLARATPTGVTVMLDAYGRAVGGHRLGLGSLGIIDAPLPRALGPTPYSRWGDRFLFLMLIGSALLAGYKDFFIGLRKA